MLHKCSVDGALMTTYGQWLAINHRKLQRTAVTLQISDSHKYNLVTCTYLPYVYVYTYARVEYVLRANSLRHNTMYTELYYILGQLSSCMLQPLQVATRARCHHHGGKMEPISVWFIRTYWYSEWHHWKWLHGPAYELSNKYGFISCMHWARRREPWATSLLSRSLDLHVQLWSGSRFPSSHELQCPI